MRLQPIAMIVPNLAGIYAPSRTEPVREVTQDEFINKYSDHSRVIQVSFETDGKSNPQQVTAYGYILDCWYIVA